MLRFTHTKGHVVPTMMVVAYNYDNSGRLSARQLIFSKAAPVSGPGPVLFWKAVQLCKLSWTPNVFERCSTKRSWTTNVFGSCASKRSCTSIVFEGWATKLSWTTNVFGSSATKRSWTSIVFERCTTWRSWTPNVFESCATKAALGDYCEFTPAHKHYLFSGNRRRRGRLI